MGGDAKTLYEEGIRQSMHQWGITDEAAITAYLNSSAVPVAPNDYPQFSLQFLPRQLNTMAQGLKKQIAIQKWLAMFPDGNEAWSDYRRGRNFILYPVANLENADIPNPTTQVDKKNSIPAF